MRQVFPGALAALAFVVACGGDGTNSLKNKAPVAKAGLDREVKPGESVAFDGSASTDEDGTIAAFSWDFGDGATGEGEKPAHAFAASGRYTVTLTVTDDEGARGSDSLEISVLKANEAPVADLVPSTNAARPGDEISFDGSHSTDDVGIASFSWDFGDGATATEAMAKHRYAAAGNFTVKLTVTDAEGLTGEATTVIRVQAPPVQLPTSSTWSWGLTDASRRGECGGFQAAALTIEIPNPAGPTSSCTLREAGGLGGSTVYTGSYTAASRHFSATHSGTGVTETIEGTFDANFTHFTGNYVVDASLLGCSNNTRPVQGTRTSPAP